MKFLKLKDFKAGWFIGHFSPAIIQTEGFEVAIHYYKKNGPTEDHIHKIATEINCIVTGKMLVDGKVLQDGDIFVVEPNECPQLIFIEDTNLVIVKVPSVFGDKYLLKDGKEIVEPPK